MHDGEPMANAPIIPDVINHHAVTIMTDENGCADVTVSKGGVNAIGTEPVVEYMIGMMARLLGTRSSQA